MKTVLLFRTSFSPQNKFEYKAMFDFASQHDWQIRTVEYMNAAVSRHWKDNPAPQPKVRELLALWKPDGCLVECGGSSSEPWLGEFGDVPTVYLDRPLIRNNPKVVCASSDADAIAAAPPQTDSGTLTAVLPRPSNSFGQTPASRLRQPMSPRRCPVPYDTPIGSS